jgi:hypothetical protein
MDDVEQIIELIGSKVDLFVIVEIIPLLHL